MLKNFTQVLSYVFCSKERKHDHKQITKTRYGRENPGRFVFGKPVLFTLGHGLSMPYSLGILVWNFYQRFVTVSTEFWLRFEPQIRPTRLLINFLFIIARAERKVRLLVKLFDFFRGWILIRLTRNLSRFVKHSVEILTWNFRKNLFRKIFCANQGYPVPKLVKFRPSIWNFILGPYCAEKIHTSTFICFFPQVPPTRLSIIFFSSLPGWEEGSFVCETVWFFSWVNTHPFDLKFVAFCPKFSGDSYVEFQEKNYFGRIFQKFCANNGYPLQKLVKFRPSIWNFILGPYWAEKIHTSTLIWFLHPGKEGGTSVNKSQKEDTGEKIQDVFFLENQFCSLSA